MLFLMLRLVKINDFRYLCAQHQSWNTHTLKPCFLSTLFWRRHVGSLLLPLLLGACSALQYQPLRSIDHINPEEGYRLQTAAQHKYMANKDDDVLMILMFSGGGTRAAAFGYGVLEEMNRQQVRIGNKTGGLAEHVDLVYGISGGSVLAAYYGLHGPAVIPEFERRFLSQNFQKVLMQQVFSVSNWPRLTSPQFGRGDLLQEQLDLQLFHGATYDDLLHRRKGPFVVISATDMTLGTRLDFLQEYFDVLCVDLTDMPVSRAVAASSAVPMVFSPLTLNNHGGQCGYHLSPELAEAAAEANGGRLNTKQSYVRIVRQYENSQKRPYIHLLDGGLTDNLGLRSLLDATEVYNRDTLYQQFAPGKVRKVVLINVNAQTQMSQDIDASADVPGFGAVLNAVVNIPIDRYSHDTQLQFQQYIDSLNQKRSADDPSLYFISVNLLDLPSSPLRDRVARIPTTFYLPREDVRNLKAAAGTLLNGSSEYQRLLHDLRTRPVNDVPEPAAASAVAASAIAAPATAASAPVAK